MIKKTKSRKLLAKQDHQLSSYLVTYYLFCISLILATTSWLWYLYQSPSLLPIRHIQIRAPYLQIQNTELRSQINPFLKRNWFSMNINALAENLSNLPWIDQISVRRQWPDTLFIHIQERKAWLRFNNNALIDSQGRLFYPDNHENFSDLPQLIGPEEKLAELIDHYQFINQQLSTLSLMIKKIALSPRGAIEILLNNNTLLALGRREPLQAVTRFVNIYPRILNDRNNRIAEKIDLRYPDGMAVQWK